MFPLFLLLAALLIATALHESGHAAAGLAAGMKLRAFIVGPFQWRVRDGRWKFQFLLSKFFSGGGQTSMIPTNPELSRGPEVLMIAGGPLSNLFTGLFTLWAALTAVGRPYEQCWQLLALISTFSLVSFAVNLIPMRPEAFYSDGAQIYQLLREGPWADLHHLIDVADSTQVTPLRPRDFNIDAIQRTSLRFTQGRQALLLRLFASYYFLDRGMIPQASEAVAEAERIYQESASDIPAELYTDFVFGAAFLRRDAAGARQWWERMGAKKPTHFGSDYWLAQSALFWVEGRFEEARVAWEKGWALAQRLPAAGIYQFDRYLYSLLRGALDQAQAAD